MLEARHSEGLRQTRLVFERPGTFDAAGEGTAIGAPDAGSSPSALSRSPAFSFTRNSASSRDEMNLAEFPLAVLSTRANPSVKTLEFKDHIRLPNGETVERKWIITAADKFGLPTATDDDVVLGLIRLTMDQGFRDPKVYFTRYELLKSLRWSTEGRSYSRLIKSLDRLSGVRIRSTNSFYDNTSKSYQTCNFGIIDAYEINDERSTRQHGAGTGAAKSYFIWSEMLFDSFKAGFVKKLDLDFYFALKSAVSRRLYRYLDKHFYYKSSIEVPLTTLAFEKVGISRSHKYTSSIKQQLEPAIQELVQMGFLSGYEFCGRGAAAAVKLFARSNNQFAQPARVPGQLGAPSQQQSPVGQQRVADRFDSGLFGEAKGRAGEERPLNEEGQAALASKLVDRGLALLQAKRLLQYKSEVELEKIERIISYFDKLVEAGDRRVSRNPAGFLYRAVESPLKFVLPGERPATEPVSREKSERSRPELKIFSTKSTRKGSERTSAASHEASRLAAVESSEEQEYRDYVDGEVAAFLARLNAEQIASLRRTAEDKISFLRGILGEARFLEAAAGCFREEVIRAAQIPKKEQWRKRKTIGR